MKKNFMTRALSVVLSAAMALSLSVVANVASADAAAAKPAFKKATKTIAADKKQVKFYTTKKTKKNFTLTKVKTASADVTVSANKAKQVITVKRAAAELAADASATIKCTFKNIKTAKKVTKNVKVNVIANKVEEEVKAQNITLDVKGASKLEATLSKNLADADKATITVNKVGADAVEGKATVEGTKVTFTTAAKLTKGSYTMTIVDGEETTTSNAIDVLDEYVDKLEIVSEDALTNKDKNEAYVYYEIQNQYGESMSESATIQWNVAGADKKAEDKEVGKLTLKPQGETKEFKFGDLISITGIIVKNAKSTTKLIKVGLEQAIDSIKAEGFININDAATLLTDLPADFKANQYRMLYSSYDQEGHIMDAAKDNVENQLVQFVSDKPLLIDFEMKDGDIYTIKGISYSSIKLNPAAYTDQGGEVTIKAISCRTGNQTVTTFTIAGAGLLKSLVISAPASIVAAGDTVELPYVATDVNGNKITDYETIVRSSNALTIQPSNVVLKEGNDGKAVISWTAPIGNGYKDSDGFAIPQTFTTIVIGGETNTTQIDVYDTRVPVQIKSVDINGGADAFVKGDNETKVEFFKCDKDHKSQVVYLDQYGAEMCACKAGDFFGWLAYADGNKYAGAKYRIEVEFAGSGAFGNDKTNTINVTSGDWFDDDKNAHMWVNADDLVFDAKGVKSDKDTVKYAITSSTDGKEWAAANKKLSAEYTVVPVEKLKDLAINAIGKQQVVTEATEYVSGKKIADKIDAGYTTPGAIKMATITNGADVKVSGKFNGKALTVPKKYLVVTSCAFTVDNFKLTGLAEDAVYYADLYDANTYARKDEAKKNLIVEVYKDSEKKDIANTLTLAVPFADSQCELASVVLESADITTSADNTEMTILISNTWKKPGEVWATAMNGNYSLKIKDQYGHDMTTDEFDYSYSVTEVVENEGALAHVLKNFDMVGNGSKQVSIVGAELGDKFTVTITVSDKRTGKTLSASAKVTVGADAQAKIASDKDFRTKKLGYVR